MDGSGNAERRDPKRITVLSAKSYPAWPLRATDTIRQDKDARRALQPKPTARATPEELAEWQEADKVALSIVRSSIPDRIFPQFTRCSTTQELFDEVRKYYEPNTEQRQMELEFELLTIRKRPDEDYMTYGARAGELWNELSIRCIKRNERGEETDSSKEASSKLENKVCYAVLNGLDEDMQWFSQMATTFAPSGLKMEVIMMHLLRQERLGIAKQRRQETEHDYSDRKPAFTGLIGYRGGGQGGGSGGSGDGGDRPWRPPMEQGRGSGGRGKGKDKSRIRCFNCGVWGHYANECPNSRSGGGQSQASGSGGQQAGGAGGGQGGGRRMPSM